jgi:hypothetical protein
MRLFQGIYFATCIFGVVFSQDCSGVDGDGHIEIANTVTSINDDAFAACSALLTISFAADSTLTTIGDSAFSSSGLTAIEIPSSVTTIGRNFCTGCFDIVSITFASGSQLTTLSSYAFYGIRTPDAPIDFELPASVTSLESTFYASIALRSFTLAPGSSLGSIEDLVFASCSSLVSVDFSASSSLTTVEALSSSYNNFIGCTALESVHFPASVTTIGNSYGDGVFLDCTSLTSVTFGSGSSLGLTFGSGSSLSTLGDNTFSGCTSLTSVTFESGSSLATLGDNTFTGCTSLTSVTFESGSSLATLGDGTFSGCTSLTNVTFESASSLTAGAIGDYTFSGCTSLTDVTLGSLRGIKNYWFSGCTSLLSIDFPAAILYIGEGAFSGCSSLSSITFASDDTLRVIGSKAFYNTNFSSITLPHSVGFIESDSFPESVPISFTTLSFPTNDASDNEHGEVWNVVVVLTFINLAIIVVVLSFSALKKCAIPGVGENSPGDRENVKGGSKIDLEDGLKKASRKLTSVSPSPDDASSKISNRKSTSMSPSPVHASHGASPGHHLGYDPLNLPDMRRMYHH